MTPIRRRLLRACLPLLLVAAPGARAVSADPADGDATAFSELLSVMAEETDVATRTKMNSDFVPGIVTVYEGDTLAAWGSRTVADALSMVPGVEPLLDPHGTPGVAVRGIPFPFNNGNIQILLNGVPIERDAAGVNGAALTIPIAQVERIEFVRGPGSVVYGEYAMMGLVNIVTRASGSAVGIEGDSRDGGTFNARHAATAGDWSLAANWSSTRSDQPLLWNDQPATEARDFGVLSLKNGGFSANLQGFRRVLDDGDASTPPNNDYQDRMTSGDLGWEGNIADDTELQWRSQYLVNVFDDGGDSFNADQSRTSVNLVWRGLAHHALLAGLDYSHGTISDAVHNPPPPPPPLPPPPPITIGTHDREVFGVLLQDQVELAEHLQATVGGRWDNNSEVGDRFTPRASIAWQVASHHVLKAQYAEGYRSPTFFELYASSAQPPLDFEVNRTTELNYVYTAGTTTARVTLFHTRVSDMVYRLAPPAVPPPGHFDNVAEATSDGTELEWSRRFGDTLRADANLTLVDSRDSRNAGAQMQDIGVSANWLANVALLWTPQQDMLLGLHLNHVGTRESAPAGDKQYDLLSVSATRRNLLGRGLDLAVGVSNALDARNVQVQSFPLGVLTFPYDDYLTTWASLTWRYR